MVLKDRIFKFFFNLFNFFCFFIVVFVTVVNAKYHVVAHDDMFVNFINIKSGFLSNFIFDIYHGRYISNALMKLNSGIIFDMHPITWMRTYGAIIKGGFLFYVLFLLSKSFFLFKKENILLPLLILSLFIFFNFSFLNHFQDMLYAAFYGFTFPFIFYFLFWNKFLKIYVTDSLILKSDKIKFFIIAVLLGISTEFTIFSTFLALIFIFIIDFLKKKKLNKELFTISIPFFLSVPFYVFNEGFINSAKGKGTLNGLGNMLNTAKDIFPEYIDGCIKTFTSDFLIYTVIIVFLYVLVFFLIEKNLRFKFSLIVSSLFISAYLFFFLLIFAGRGCSDQHLFVVHFDTNFQIIICFIFIILIELAFLYKYKKLQTILLSSFVYILLFVIFSFPQKISEILSDGILNYSSFYHKEEAMDRYRNEAMFLFYAKNNVKDVIMPVDFQYYSEEYLYNVYNIDNYNPEIKIVDTEDEAYIQYLKLGGREITQAEMDKNDFNLLRKID